MKYTKCKHLSDFEWVKIAPTKPIMELLLIKVVQIWKNDDINSGLYRSDFDRRHIKYTQHLSEVGRVKMAPTKPINGIIDHNLIALGFTNCLKRDAAMQSNPRLWNYQYARIFNIAIIKVIPIKSDEEDVMISVEQCYCVFSDQYFCHLCMN